MTRACVEAYVDGSSSGSVGPGGWGAVLLYESSDGRRSYEKELTGGEEDTTNNRMEIMAAVGALEAIKPGGYEVTVYSDSAYVVNCMRRGWHEKWAENGWRTSAKSPVANVDLWERLLEAVGRHQRVTFQKVKGHSRATSRDARMNERADRLAVGAKRAATREAS